MVRFGFCDEGFGLGLGSEITGSSLVHVREIFTLFTPGLISLLFSCIVNWITAILGIENHVDSHKTTVVKCISESWNMSEFQSLS